MIWSLIAPIFMRSKFANNVFIFYFDLMNDLLVTSTMMRSKFASNAFLNIDLMNDLLAASVIMRLKLQSNSIIINCSGLTKFVCYNREIVVPKFVNVVNMDFGTLKMGKICSL